MLKCEKQAERIDELELELKEAKAREERARDAILEATQFPGSSLEEDISYLAADLEAERAKAIRFAERNEALKEENKVLKGTLDMFRGSDKVMIARINNAGVTCRSVGKGIDDLIDSRRKLQDENDDVKHDLRNHKLNHKGTESIIRHLINQNTDICVNGWNITQVVERLCSDWNYKKTLLADNAERRKIAKSVLGSIVDENLSTHYIDEAARRVERHHDRVLFTKELAGEAKEEEQIWRISNGLQERYVMASHPTAAMTRYGNMSQNSDKYRALVTPVGRATEPAICNSLAKSYHDIIMRMHDALDKAIGRPGGTVEEKLESALIQLKACHAAAADARKKDQLKKKFTRVKFVSNGLAIDNETAKKIHLSLKRSLDLGENPLKKLEAAVKRRLVPTFSFTIPLPTNRQRIEDAIREKISGWGPEGIDYVLKHSNLEAAQAPDKLIAWIGAIPHISSKPPVVAAENRYSLSAKIRMKIACDNCQEEAP